VNSYQTNLTKCPNCGLEKLYAIYTLAHAEGPAYYECAKCFERYNLFMENFKDEIDGMTFNRNWEDIYYE
jgi:transcription elongation factor Elf1